MEQYRIHPNFVIRKYGAILLGYFETDEQIRYYSFEGAVAQYLELLTENNGAMPDIMQQGPKCDYISEKELLDLINYRIIEVI